MIDEEIVGDTLTSELDFLLPTRFNPNFQRNPFILTNKKVELQMQESCWNSKKSKEDSFYEEKSCQSPTLDNFVKVILLEFTHPFRNSNETGGSKDEENEEVQLEEEEKNQTVPLVMLKKIPRALASKTLLGHLSDYSSSSLSISSWISSSVRDISKKWTKCN